MTKTMKPNSGIARKLVQEWDTNNAMCLLGDHEADLITNIERALDAKDEAAATALAELKRSQEQHVHALKCNAELSDDNIRLEAEVAEARSTAFDDAIGVAEAKRDEWLKKIDLVTGPKFIDLEAADQFASAVTAAKQIIAALTTARSKKAEVE